MMLGVVFSLLGIRLLIGPMVLAAVFALSLFVGVAAGRFAYGTGAGALGSIIVGAVAAGGALGLAQVLLAVTRSTALRLITVVAFAGPAAVAGYFVVLGLAHIGSAHGVWPPRFAGIGAVIIAGAALTRRATPLIAAQDGRRAVSMSDVQQLREPRRLQRVCRGVQPDPAAAPVATRCAQPGAARNIWPTEIAPIIRRHDDGGELAQLRWGFAPARPKGAPVINFRSEGRRFSHGRCLIPASHFSKFTGAKSPKAKWRFTKAGEDWFCIAGLWRPAAGETPETFTLLTSEPGPDVAPIHNRQVVVLERSDWAAWLDPATAEADLLRPSPAGSLTVEQVR